MPNYRFEIISDSCLDLSDEQIKENNIHVVPFRLSYDSLNYLSDGVDIRVREVYDFLVSNPGKYFKTSMPSVEDYRAIMEKAAQSGRDVLCITMTSSVTSSVQSANLAKRMVEETFPQQKIIVIDSLAATVLQGMFVIEAIKLRDAGLSIDDAEKKLKEIIPTGEIFFSMGTLDYLIHGGRLGKISGRVASTLKIQPMVFLHSGELGSNGIARSRKQAMDKIVDTFIKHIKDNNINPEEYNLASGFGYDIEEGIEFNKRVMAALKKEFSYTGELMHMQIGTIIAAYIGPDPIGLGLIKKVNI